MASGVGKAARHANDRDRRYVLFVHRHCAFSETFTDLAQHPCSDNQKYPTSFLTAKFLTSQLTFCKQRYQERLTGVPGYPWIEVHFLAFFSIFILCAARIYGANTRPQSVRQEDALSFVGEGGQSSDSFPFKNYKFGTCGRAFFHVTRSRSKWRAYYSRIL